MKDVESRAAALFKRWIVKRENGGCQVLFPLTELDHMILMILKLEREAWNHRATGERE